MSNVWIWQSLIMHQVIVIVNENSGQVQDVRMWLAATSSSLFFSPGEKHGVAMLRTVIYILSISVVLCSLCAIFENGNENYNRYTGVSAPHNIYLSTDALDMA